MQRTDPTAAQPPDDPDARYQSAIAALRARVAELEASEAKARQEAATLQQQLRLLQAVVNTSADAVFVKDLSGRYVMVNRAFAELVRKPVRDLVGRDDLELFPEDMANHIRQDDAQVLEQGTTQTFEEIGTSTGKMRIYCSTKGVWRDEQGQVAGVIGFARDITEQRAAEKASRENEERFRNLIEGSVQGILIRHDDRALFVNQAYATILGYETPDDIYRLPSVDVLIAPHERDRLNHYRKSRLSGQAAPTHYEYQGLRQDGSLVWLEMQVRVVNWMGDCAIQSTVVDITERKRAEDALRENEERYRAVVESAILGIIMVREGQCYFANPALANLLGYTHPDEMVGRDMWDHVPADERPRLQGYINARRRGDPIPPSYELQALTRQGSTIWLEYTFTRIILSGQPVGLATVHNITERKQTEAQLRARETQFRTLVEHSLAGIYIIQDGLYQYVNPKFAEIFGYTPEDITTRVKQGETLVAEMDRPKVQANVQKRLRGETDTLSYTYRGQRRDGTLIDVELHGAAMEYQGRPAVIGTLLDVTERNRTQAALLQTQRLASIGILAAGIAHQINNPIGIMLLAADQAKAMIEHPSSKNEIIGCLETIITEAERCRKIVTSILQFARQRPIDSWPDDLNKTMHHAVTITRSYASFHRVGLELELAPSLPQVLINPTIIEQVIINLLRNAIEAGARRVRVHTAVCDGQVQYDVQDDGRGLTLEEQQHVFDPFYTTRLQTGGTGLGLSIAYRIVQEHHATIKVESAPTQGTTFTISFTLPEQYSKEKRDDKRAHC